MSEKKFVDIPGYYLHIQVLTNSVSKSNKLSLPLKSCILIADSDILTVLQSSGSTLVSVSPVSLN